MVDVGKIASRDGGRAVPKIVASGGSDYEMFVVVHCRTRSKSSVGFFSLTSWRNPKLCLALADADDSIPRQLQST